jgi:uncharacterized protein YndB with AHSA1/START domain
MNGVEHGCLVIADISGYTKYLTGVELEHSTDILADLIGVVVDNLCAFTLAKLEGDAVFCYEPDERGDAHALVNTIESCYFAFMQRQRNITAATSCPCDACRHIPSLNLKFVAHAGQWARHEVAGNTELVGPDVIMVHRLLKNTVVESTGIRGYAFFSAACLDRVRVDPAALRMVEHIESYDDVGDVRGWVHDVGARWAEEQERRVVFIAKGEAPFEFECELAVPPPVAWEFVTAQRWRRQWQAEDVIEDPSARGVRGAGTTSHCVHGRVKTHHEILDWKPFRYVSSRDRTPLGDFDSTFELTPVAEGRSVVAFRSRPAGGRLQRIAIKAAGGKFKALSEQSLRNLTALVDRERAGTGEPAKTG